MEVHRTLQVAIAAVLAISLLGVGPAGAYPIGPEPDKISSDDHRPNASPGIYEEKHTEIYDVSVAEGGEGHVLIQSGAINGGEGDIVMYGAPIDGVLENVSANKIDKFCAWWETQDDTFGEDWEEYCAE